jgi:hypothetical protein
MPSVTTPMPIAVKKLIANRVFCGSSVGNMPVRQSCSEGSFSRSTTSFWPSDAMSSSNMILMKIRELEVVSSSFSFITSKTVQLMASEAN